MLASLFSLHSVKRLHSLTFVYLHNVLSLLLAFVVNSVSRVTRMKTAGTENITYLDIYNKNLNFFLINLAQIIPITYEYKYTLVIY